MANNHSERGHALLSASGASRWINCTPSARMEESVKDTRSSVYAEEGTFAHELAELGLKEHLWGTSRANLRGKWCLAQRAALQGSDWYSDEMQEHVDFYVNYVIERHNEHKGASLLIEEKINLSNIIEGGFGTNDAVIVSDNHIIVIDLKFGRGNLVSAEDNSQLKLYAYGSLKANELNYTLEDDATVELVIVQPRRDSVSTYKINAKELVKWAEGYVKERAAMAYEGKGECNPGAWCQWCKVAAKCRANAEYCTADVREDFAAQSKELTDGEIAELLAKRDMISNWLDTLSSFALSEALAGKQWPGYKLVAARTQRRWVDDKEVASVLVDKGFKPEEIYVTKLQGIGAIEKLVGKKEFPDVLGHLTTKPEGQPTLAPLSDKREALSLDTAASDFQNELE